MARVLVLSFKDNSAAEILIRSLDRIQEQDWTLPEVRFGELGVILAANAKVEAILARPVAGCKHRFVKGQPWKKTEVFGWYVHDVEGCKRPAATVVRDFIKNMLIASGNNLLPALRESWHNKEEDVLDPEETSQTTPTETTAQETQGDFSENQDSTG